MRLTDDMGNKSQVILADIEIKRPHICPVCLKKKTEGKMFLVEGDLYAQHIMTIDKNGYAMREENGKLVRTGLSILRCYDCTFFDLSEEIQNDPREYQDNMEEIIEMLRTEIGYDGSVVVETEDVVELSSIAEEIKEIIEEGLKARGYNVLATEIDNIETLND